MKVETLSRLCAGQTMITWRNFFFAGKLMLNHWWKR